MSAKPSTKRKSFMAQALEGTGPTPPPTRTSTSNPAPQTPEPRASAEVVPLPAVSRAQAPDPAPEKGRETAAERTPVTPHEPGLNISAWPRGEASPYRAKQQGRSQVRLTEPVATNVAETEQLIWQRTGRSLNAIREIAIWAILGNPDNADRFVRELLPAWLQASHEATERSRTDPDA